MYLDTPLAPSINEALVVNEMFKKKNIKKTRMQHTLWARGLHSKLALSVSQEGLCVSDGKGVVLESPVQKVFFATNIDSSLFVFIRRSGFEFSFKCQVFVLSSTKEAEAVTALLTRLTSMLGFRRQSMSMVPRTNSVCSVDMLPDGYTESPMSSRNTSRVNSDEEDSDQESPSPAATIPTPVVSDHRPCGICLKVDGDNWIALKTCGHQHHLACISQWRVEHNICPCCSVPVSATAFSLLYLGGCFSEDKVSKEEVNALGADYKSTAIGAEVLRVQVSNTQINFLDHLGSNKVDVKSCNLLADLRDLHLIDSLIVLVIADGSGSLVQIFEPKYPKEAPMVFAALKTACHLK